MLYISQLLILLKAEIHNLTKLLKFFPIDGFKGISNSNFKLLISEGIGRIGDSGSDRLKTDSYVCND